MPLIKPAAVTARHDPASMTFQLLSCVRMSEVLLLQGSPLLGAIFAMSNLTVTRCVAMTLLASGSTLVTAHVFLLNDWSGVNCDLRDPHRTNSVFTRRGIGRNAIAYLSLALLSSGLVLLSRFGLLSLTIALGISGLSALYSFPRAHLKGIPVLNSILHFAGGLLHFLLGYSIFATPDWRGIQISGFFGLVFVAGHLTHETRDSDSDRLSNIRTNAVKFGKMHSFLAGLAIFTVADVLLMTLALWRVVPRSLAFVVLLCPLHVYWSISAIRSGLTFESIQRIQFRYRAFYAVTGLWMVIAALLETQRRGSFAGILLGCLHLADSYLAII